MNAASFTDSTHSGNAPPHLPNQHDSIAADNTSRVVDSASQGLSSSMRERVSSLRTSIQETFLPETHRENNAAIESRNEKLSNFLRTVKQTLKNPGLAEADIRNSVLSDGLSLEGLPEDLVAPIRAEFKRLPTENRTFGALSDIVLKNKQEEKCVFSNYGTRLMQLVVDYGTTDFTTTPKVLTDKNKTHTIAQIKETFSENSPVKGAFLATGKLLETVYKTTADRGLVGKYNLIDQCAKTFRDKVHDGSSWTITKVAVTLLAFPLLGLKLASKAARFGLGVIAVLGTIALAAFLGVCLAAGFAIKEGVQLVGRKIGYYDNDVAEYFKYRIPDAAYHADFFQLNVSRKLVKLMENDADYQTFKKEAKGEE